MHRLSPCNPLPELDLTILLDYVVTAGNMTVTFLGTENPGPELRGFRPLAFFAMDTTALIEGVQIEIVYDETILDLDKGGELLGEEALRILHLHKTWEDVTTSLDTFDNTIGAQVPGLSSFAVVLECMKGAHDCENDVDRYSR